MKKSTENGKTAETPAVETPETAANTEEVSPETAATEQPEQVAAAEGEEKEEEEKKPEPKIVKSKQMLKYDFSADELVEHSQALAEAVVEHGQAETRKKGVVKSLDMDIAQIETKIGSLAGKVKDGYEYRDIDVEYRFDYEKRIKNLYRMDNGALVKTIPLTVGELQQGLPGLPTNDE